MSNAILTSCYSKLTAADEEHLQNEVLPPKRAKAVPRIKLEEVRPRAASVCISLRSFIFYHIIIYCQPVPSEIEDGKTRTGTHQTRAFVGKASKFKTSVVPRQSTRNTGLVKAEAVENGVNSALIDQIRTATRFRDLPSTISNSTVSFKVFYWLDGFRQPI